MIVEKGISTMKKWFKSAFLITVFFITVNQTAQAATFTDVPTHHWAHEAITSASTQGIINGYANGTYRPNDQVTRAQAAKIIALSINAKPSAAFKPQFQDVDQSNRFYDDIRALTELGIFADGDKFNPNQSLTRAQMANVLTLGYKIIVDDNDLIQLGDVTKQNQFHGPITTLVETAITATPSGGNFNPNDNVSRAQIASFVDCAMKFDLKREKGIIYYDNERRMYIDKSEPKPLPPVVVIQDNAFKTIDLVNEQRRKLGAKNLIHDVDLSKIAKIKAEDMAKNNYFAHESPTYGNVGQMLNKFNYKWSSYGENIAKGYTTPTLVVDGWMNSPGHRSNIMDTRFTHIGSGYATDTKGITYWVHQFSTK